MSKTFIFLPKISGFCCVLGKFKCVHHFRVYFGSWSRFCCCLVLKSVGLVPTNLFVSDFSVKNIKVYKRLGWCSSKIIKTSSVLWFLIHFGDKIWCLFVFGCIFRPNRVKNRVFPIRHRIKCQISVSVDLVSRACYPAE